MRACNWNVTDSKKTVFDLIIRGKILDMTVQWNVPRFCTGSICGWKLFQQLGLTVTLVTHFPGNKGGWPDADTRSGQRLRRWSVLVSASVALGELCHLLLSGVRARDEPSEHFPTAWTPLLTLLCSLAWPYKIKVPGDCLPISWRIKVNGCKIRNWSEVH